MLFRWRNKKTDIKQENLNLNNNDSESRGKDNSKDIAIVGMSARFPEASNYNQFWDNIKQSKVATREIPEERWNWKKYYKIDGKIKNRTVSRWGCFVKNVDTFDLRFFSISQREADAMDPQQRILLEEAWACFEDAGIRPSKIAEKRVGVFVAACHMDFRDLLERNQENIVPHYTLGIHPSILANRISYLFNLKGPSVQLDTGCAGSLTSVHYAAESIINGECEMALAGGVNIIIAPNNNVRLSKMLMLSPTGVLRAFDKDADGYVRGEGAGFVLLKPLKRALEDGDPIYAVIKSTAINHCGKTISISYPSLDAQAEVIADALHKADVPVESIGYVELHGTGTPKGDPVEFEGLKKAFTELSPTENSGEKKIGYCGLGSVKTNIGHLEAAAGIASIIKVILSMKYCLLPATANFEQLNPAIDMGGTPFYLVNRLHTWERTRHKNGEYPRRAGISSFGLGGANAHIILEQASQDEKSHKRKDEYYLICLSAKTDRALQRKAIELYDFLKQHGNDVTIDSISYTLLCGRDHFEKRISIVTDSIQGLKDSLLATQDYLWTKNEAVRMPENNEISAIIAERAENEEDKHSKEYKKYLEMLAEYYVNSADAEWEKLFDVGCKMAHIPTYPFEPTKCWIPDANKLVDNVLPFDNESDVPINEYEMLTFEEVWEPSGDMKVNQEMNSGDLIFFTSQKNPESGLGIRVFEDGDSNKHNYFYVESGIEYKKISENRFVINANQKEDYINVLREIKNKCHGICAIIDTRPLCDSTFRLSPYGIVHILQGLVSNGIKGIGLMVAGGYENEIERCYVESWIGFERSVGMAMRGTEVKVVLGSLGEYNRLEWNEILQKEISIGMSGSVLYEDGKRKVLKVREKSLDSSKRSILKYKGSYLITGGTGGLGILFAKYLLTKYNANLVLIGRSNPESRQDELRKLKGIGGTVRYIQADVCNVNQMLGVIEEINKSFGGLNGIIHAAGVEIGNSIVEKDEEEFYATIAPKIEGTLVIDRIVENQNLDFICYFSSSSAILGDFGSCDYSIGNRFLQAFAKYKNNKGNAKGTKVAAIHWPLWENGGMELMSDDTTQMYLKSSGQKSLSDDDGTRIFDQILAQDEYDYLVINGKRENVVRFLGLNKALKAERKEEKDSNIVERKIDKPKKDDVMIDLCVMEDLKEISSSILKLSKNEIHSDTNFADIGFESVNLGDFAMQLSDKFKIDITPDVFFGYPTLNKLKDFFMGKYPGVMERFYCNAGSEALEKEFYEVKAVKSVGFVEEPGHMSADFNKPYNEPIAIIGMSGQFPGADNINELWEILKNGKEVIREIPKERIEFSEEDSCSEKGIPWRMGMISNPAGFDPLFFEISPGEAESMDPRQRLLLEEIWKALEDAGCGDDDLNDANIGTFIGVEDGDYRLITGEDTRVTSNHNSILAARIAYFLNLRGASMAINTACSSGLTALHQACLSLRSNDCDEAVVAGVSLVLRKESYLGMARAGMLSEEGRCYAFDKRADGMVPAEAVAVIVLKKLSLAQRDGNQIYATILGTGINYDGRTNGITAPSGRAQLELYKGVYKKLGISPRDISYIVTHGTGTRLGDPIEINALNDAFRDSSEERGYCAITSVKANIGHALAASGIVSVINLVLAMKNRMIPPSINCEQESEYIRWSDSPLYINRHKKEWGDINGKKRIGAVSAFGFSGTNVHVVLQSYEQGKERSTEAIPYYMLVFSAKNKASLNKKLFDMAAMLKENRDIDMASLSYTLLDGRCHFQYRCAVIVSNAAEAISILECLAGGQKAENAFFGEVDREFYEQPSSRDYINSCILSIQKEIKNKNQLMNNLHMLMQFYCQGYKISGKQLFGQDIPSYVKLPAYPFDNQEYWFGNKDIAVHQTNQHNADRIEKAVKEETEERLIVPVWKAAVCRLLEKNPNENTVLICDNPEIEKIFARPGLDMQIIIGNYKDSIHQIIDKIESAGQINHLIWVAPFNERDLSSDEEIVKSQEKGVYSLFKITKALLSLGYGGQDIRMSVVTILGQCVEERDVPNPCHAGIDGFACVLAKEIPNWHVGIFDLDSFEECPVKDIMYCSNDADGSVLSHRNRIWYTQDIIAYKPKDGTGAKVSGYKNHGVYVVIGGAGGIGFIWSKYMICKYNARIVWIGRSEFNAEIGGKVHEISRYGTEPVYVQSDVTDGKSLESAYKDIKARFGSINGIVHSAVGSFDKGIVGMEEESFRRVIEVKTDGAVNINRVFGKESLDFVLFFSSLSSFEKPQGQSGYVAGCSFIDAYAKYLSNKAPYTVRTINWGFWGNVGAGMKMPESIKIRISLTGARPLEPEAAMAVTETSLGGSAVQLGYTKVAKANSLTVNTDTSNSTAEIHDVNDIREYCSNTICKIISSVLKIPADKFDTTERMEKYGLDSITVLQMIHEFKRVFPRVESTIFYEYATIDALTDYFVNNYSDKIIKDIGSGSNNFKVTECTKIKKEIKSSSVSYLGDAIAVIGMSGKFPKAENINELWENLKAGRDCVTEIPESRWNMEDFYVSDMELAIKEKKSYCKFGGFIDGFADFDPRFFKISPKEAISMDPQERYLLEECWKVFEDAGYTSKKIQGRFNGNVGVFVGVTRTGFDYYAPELWSKGENQMLSTSFSAMSNRISYVFNLNGPSMSIDTMCSSSLTALHEACEHIKRGECGMALLGSANIYTHPATYKQFCQKRMLSQKGRCHTFGADADGFVPGEGVGVILLKLLSQALRDNDHIYSIIRSTTVNHGGRTNGFTVPNPIAQKNLICEAMERAKVNAEEISYIEAHGTGTLIGDPIEINGLTKAFASHTAKKQYCAIGSVKTNIGHCEATAGLAGLIKVILQMENALLVPSLHADVLNPLIDFGNSPFYVQRGLSKWERPIVKGNGVEKECPRIAGISSFGAGGSNAHAIIEEFQQE